MNTNHFQDVKDHILDQLGDRVGLDQKGQDLPNELLNTGYFSSSTNHAKKWLGNCIFDAIKDINEYEDFHYGERYTDTSDPMKVVNMWVLIKGEEILYNCLHLTTNSDRYLTKYTLQLIAAEVKAA